MAKVSAIQKNKRRQKLVASHAKKRASLKEVIMDRELPPEERLSLIHI